MELQCAFDLQQVDDGEREHRWRIGERAGALDALEKATDEWTGGGRRRIDTSVDEEGADGGEMGANRTDGEPASGEP